MTSRIPKPGELYEEIAWSAQELELLQAGRHEATPHVLQERMREVFERNVVQSLSTSVDTGFGRSVHSQNASGASLRNAGWFGPKLALWGTLGLIVLGSAVYLTANRLQTAGDQGQAQPSNTPHAPESVARLAAANAGTRADAVPALASEVASRVTKPDRARDPQPMAAGSEPQPRAAGVDRDRDTQLLVASGPQSRAEAAARDRRTQLVAAVAASNGQAATRRAAVSSQQANELHAQVAHPRAAIAERAEAARSSQRHSIEVEETRNDQLRVEAELLDGARRALSRGALPEAGQLLERYSAQFAHGVLHPESDVLCIELQMRRGEPDAAKAQASRFLSLYPSHPLSDRVRALIAAQLVPR